MWDDGSNDEEEVQNSMDDEDDFSDDYEIVVNSTKMRFQFQHQ